MLKLSNSEEDQRKRNLFYATDEEFEEVKPLIKIFICLLLVVVIIIAFF